MDRRAFVAGILALLAGPLAGGALPAGKVYRIGLLYGPRGRAVRSLSSRLRAWSSESRAGLLAMGLFALGAVVRALRFAGRFATPYHWDETGLAVPAVYLLQGALPVHFLDIEYTGATAA